MPNELGGVGSGPIQVVDRQRLRLHHQGDELRHCRPFTIAKVGVVDVLTGGEHDVAVTEHVNERRLVHDRPAYVSRMRREQGQQADAAAA